MKRKEREHLKEDPFQVFIRKVLDILKQFKKEIYIGLGVIAAVVVVLTVMSFLRYGSVSSENRLYKEALDIRNSETLNLEQKIEKLTQLDYKRGISSSSRIVLATLHFQNGDMEKAQKELADFSGSKFKLINEKKELLDAEILAATGKGKEALDRMYALYSDAGSEISKDYLLLRMAKIQIKAGQLEPASINLKKLTEEFPQSMYSREGQTLLTEIENK